MISLCFRYLYLVLCCRNRLLLWPNGSNVLCSVHGVFSMIYFVNTHPNFIVVYQQNKLYIKKMSHVKFLAQTSLLLAFAHSVFNIIFTVYVDVMCFRWGLCYAGACYTMTVCCIMAAGLVHQICLISQNATSQELHRASLQGNTFCAIFRYGNPYNHGLLQNWSDFILKKRSVSNHFETV